jgi:hypothetical protein
MPLLLLTSYTNVILVLGALSCTGGPLLKSRVLISGNRRLGTCIILFSFTSHALSSILGKEHILIHAFHEGRIIIVCISVDPRSD